jgi:hypothetical protein
MAALTSIQISISELYFCFAFIVALVFFFTLRRPIWGYICLISINCLLFLGCIKSWQHRTTDHLTFYCTSKGNALAHISGDASTVLGDSTFWGNPFAIKQTSNDWLMRTGPIRTDTITSCCYTFGNFTLFIPRKGYSQLGDEAIDAVWMVDPGFEWNFETGNTSIPKLILVSPFYPKHKAESLREKLPKGHEIIDLQHQAVTIGLLAYSKGI